MNMLNFIWFQVHKLIVTKIKITKIKDENRLSR